MSKSNREVEIGRAGEHFVCYDLILQGYSAFLSEQGLPFDVIVTSQNRLLRVQVKSTAAPNATGRYHFASGGRQAKRAKLADVDYFAFVALDIKRVAYLPVSELVSPKGLIVSTVEFRSRSAPPPEGRVYSSGATRQLTWSKFIEDYGTFDPQKANALDNPTGLVVAS